VTTSADPPGTPADPPADPPIRPAPPASGRRVLGGCLLLFGLLLAVAVFAGPRLIAQLLSVH
jgi:hypothetical protein